MGKQDGGVEEMSRNRLHEQEGLLPEQVNPECWPTIDESSLSNVELEIYTRRKQAVLMYFRREGTLSEVKEATSVDSQTIRRLVKRCMSPDETGVIWGFRGLIPQKKIKTYELNLLSEERNESRKTGEFNLLLEKYPDLKDLIDDLYLGRNRRTLEPAMKPKSIHKKLIEACRMKGISQSEYPFNTKYMGSKAVQRYLKRLAYLYFGKAVSRYGHDAEQRARYSGVGEQNHPITLTPFQKVQFDAHRIDGLFAVNIATPEGEEVTKVLDRFWILTLIDVATRNIIGYSISLNMEYSASDVMQCIRNSILPHEKLSLTIDGLTYHEIGGFPSEVYPEAKWATWDVICFDNAKSHLANMVKERLKNLIGCATNFGPVDLPMRRGLIERFFQLLEEMGFHRLPNTTGSNPNDPRRKNPAENAVKWNITYDHLKELIDVLISNYNGTPHGGIHYQSPLELLGKRIDNGLLPRLIEEEKRSEVLFLQTTITRTVRGSVKSGKKPYVQYEGVEYRSDKLSNSPHLINSEFTIHVNVDDLRTMRAYHKDGSEFGYLTAVGKWSLTPHSLQTRKAINSLVLRKLIHYTSWDDPIFVYTDYLMRNSSKIKRGATNKITKVKEHAQQVNRKINEPVARTEALESAAKHNEALEKARSISKQQEQDDATDRYEHMLTKYKTQSI